MAQNFIDAPSEQQHDPRTTPADPAPPQRGTVIAVAASFLLLVLVGIAFLIPKLRHRDALVTEARETMGPPEVDVVRVQTGSAESRLELPGTVQAFEQTPIYARTSGYIRKRYVDIGDHVRAGQLLATIEDPQTEQSLRQAQASLLQLKAQLLQARANAHLTTLNNQRYEQLYQQGVVSRESADQQAAQSGANDATVQAAQANIAAGEANVRSLQEQAGFSKVVAPFTGTILSRGIDNGSLISAGSATSVTQLFTIGQSGTVRVFTNVPQASAPAVLTARTAQVQFRELPGQTFTGTIARTSSSIDPSSRTLLAEIDLPNSDGRILPGMFATVLFNTRSTTPPLLIPANALLVRSAGPQAFVVDSNHIAHLRNLTLGRDFGASTEVLNGLRPGDMVILSPGDNVTDGAKVDPHTPAAAAAS
ncbi:efflux RND transporter periplasmic adaptor subunit [Terriglobus aquaticus]|uniref:Efflux RND transporter periplasmic adaptor subunit n=1 Tax=Terriglobus aquaticus TaxID=940139 RepID=A0ABW9KL04_9BACT|nr:efflux RND transporter periplasmic adaptor subunit [Terriglobus aquaticus]